MAYIVTGRISVREVTMTRPTTSLRTGAAAGAVLLALLSGGLGWTGPAAAQQPAAGAASGDGLDVQALRPTL